MIIRRTEKLNQPFWRMFFICDKSYILTVFSLKITKIVRIFKADSRLSLKTQIKLLKFLGQKGLEMGTKVKCIEFFRFLHDIVAA